MATPQITLTATLVDYSGAALGSATQPAWVRIALCNYGPTLPCIPGTANIGKVSSWFVDVPYPGAQITVKLWGNDQITPAGTYYQISVLDTNRNVVQSGIYQFTGMATIDLSSAPQITPPQPAGLAQLVFQACTGAVPGTNYTAPGQIVAVAYNGVLLEPGLSAPELSYTVTGSTIALNFSTQAGDRIYALCIVS
jgi:hypothetical protein